MAETVFDPYAALGVRPGADAAQVKKAYRRLARQHHPDRSGDRRTTERMKAINRAWAILSDATRRADHDASTATTRQSSTAHWSTSRRRATYWAPPPPAWSAGTAAAVPPYRSAVPTMDDGRSWFTIAAAILLLVVLGPVLFLLLPLPFSGLFVLLAIGALTRGDGD
jgi:hypothetical protein